MTWYMVLREAAERNGLMRAGRTAASVPTPLSIARLKRDGEVVRNTGSLPNSTPRQPA
jgi:hypothetical protein